MKLSFNYQLRPKIYILIENVMQITDVFAFCLSLAFKFMHSKQEFGGLKSQILYERFPRYSIFSLSTVAKNLTPAPHNVKHITQLYKLHINYTHDIYSIRLSAAAAAISDA